MRRTILLYGVLLALLTAGLKFLEYHYLIRSLSIEVYVGLIALLFTALGIWVGTRLLQKKAKPVVHLVQDPFQLNKEVLKQYGLSAREYEVLELIAQGCSNQEIADKLFVSLSTIKTHSANLFSKLDVKRRTQAVQRAKELQLIP